MQPTLQRKDLTNFFKRLRSEILKDQKTHFNGPNKDLRDESRRYLKENEKSGKLSSKVRYFACGEYGSKGNRPHYHIILFNVPLRYYKWDEIHQEWFSNKLEDLWGKGLIHIGNVERGSAHYTAKYTIKNMIDGWDENDPRQKPYAVMSRNPGIGNNYINEQNINYHNHSETSHTRLKSGHIQPLGRYIKDKIWPVQNLTDGIHVYPQERVNANKKSIEHLCIQNNTRLTQEIAKEEGDIQQAENNIREQRKAAYEQLLRKTNKSINKNNKL